MQKCANPDLPKDFAFSRHLLEVVNSKQALRPPHPSCLCPPLSPPSELVQGVAVSTSAVTPFRSFVQTPTFSVSPSSFGLQLQRI